MGRARRGDTEVVGVEALLLLVVVVVAGGDEVVGAFVAWDECTVGDSRLRKGVLLGVCLAVAGCRVGCRRRRSQPTGGWVGV